MLTSGLTMRRIAKLSALTVGSLLSASLIAMAWFDVTYVRPAASKARTFLAQASTTERQPPRRLAHLLAASDGGNEMASALVRRLLQLEPAQVNGLRTTQRQLLELGIMTLIGWHLDESELIAARLASAHLGANVVGFERGATVYFHAPLERLSREQLAELVALERAPTASPEGVRRVKQRLLDRTA